MTGSGCRRQKLRNQGAATGAELNAKFAAEGEAFKVYDPDGTGFVDTDVLRSMFENLGFGEVTDEDLMILIETGDVDKDGKINLSGMLDFNASMEQPPRQEAPFPPRFT